MLPAVSTGPLDPVFSPDGRWIAFSMRGDIWKVPAEGGDAIALTAGPAYYFEPAWSPDGKRIALSMDTGDANLDIGIVSAEGGAVTRVTSDTAVDVEPAWNGDGLALYYVSARGRGFHIFRHDLARHLDSLVTPEPGSQIQPTVSPDGQQWTSPDDAPFLAELTESIWTRVDRSAPWRSAAERAQFHAEIERARAVYEKLARAGSTASR